MNAPPRRPQREADDDSAKCYELGLSALREINIRRGQIAPRPGDKTEERWAAEGPRKPSELESARG